MPHVSIPLGGLFALSVFLGSFALPAAAASDPRVSESYGRLPLHFEANRGQTHKDVRFLSRGLGYSLYLTADEAVLVLPKLSSGAKRDLRSTPERLDPKVRARSVALRMRLVGAARKPLVSGLEELPGKTNYFIGKDPAKWRSEVPTYAKVHYREVYPGIDLLYYGNQRQLEHDFVVAPGADPDKIVLGFKGAERLEIDAQGELVLHTAGGDIRQRKPVIYQEIDGVRREIDGGYVFRGANRVGFKMAAYDASRQLVIDPVLAYSTYLGGSGFDQGSGIAVDANGNAYVTGVTSSIDFPTTAGAFQTTSGSGGISNGFSDTFVTKLNPTGSGLVYSTYLGGSRDDPASGIAVDAHGNAYIAGSTSSTDFPTTAGAFQTTFGGGSRRAFVTKLDPTGSALVYSTYLGGGAADIARAIAVGAAGSAYVTGRTDSINFPTTVGAFQTAFGGFSDAFVTKLDPSGSTLVYSTYLGGSSEDDAGGISVDAGGNAYMTGSTRSANFPTTAAAFQTTLGNGIGIFDAFVTKLDPTGSGLVYSTYLGGSAGDAGRGIAVDTAGNAYVTGSTFSTNFPTTAGAFQMTFGGGISGFFSDAFVTKLDHTGSGLVYSTYLGGSSNDAGSSVAVDAKGNAYVTGSTSSTDFPTTAGAFQMTFGGYAFDAFVTKLNRTGSAPLVYSTYLGGMGIDADNGIALDASSIPNAYVTGPTDSSNFPTTTGAFQSVFAGGSFDGFVAKIAESLPFTSFAAKAQIELRPGANDDRFAVEALFTLGVGNNGINPLSENVTIGVGTGDWSIPAGSFRPNGLGGFAFRGFIGATSLGVLIQPLSDGSFGFAAAGAHAELSGTANPVPVTLTIGDDGGGTSVVATFISP